MEIVLNGTELTLPDDCTVADLLERQQLAQRRVAVEINGAIVARSRQPEQRLSAGDRVEIVQALGGG